MSHGFDNLRTVRPFDAITMRIPARWACGPMQDDTDRWVCDEEEDEDWTASLWIMLDVLPVSPEKRPAPIKLTMDTARKISECRRAAEDGLEVTAVEETAEGAFVTCTETSVEDGDLLRHLWFYRVVHHDWGAALLYFNLVILEENRPHPEFRKLVAFVEDEIRNAAFSPPPHWIGFTGASAAVRPLLDEKIINFEDVIKIDMPARVEMTSADDGSVRWHGRFPENDPPARVVVGFQRHDLHGREDEAAAIVTSLTAAWPADARATRLKKGKFCAHVEAGDVSGAGQCRHVWRYVSPQPQEVLDIRVELSFPAALAEAAPFPYLVQRFEGAVRDTVFVEPTDPPDWLSADLETKRAGIRDGVSIRVPTDWITWSEDDGVWWAQSPDELADLKVQLQSGIQLDNPPEDRSPLAMRQALEDQIVGFVGRLKPVVPMKIHDVRSGRMVEAVTEMMQQGEMWRNHRWYIMYALEDTLGLARYMLSLRRDLADTPHGHALIAHFDKEAHSLHIATDDAIADPLASLRDVSLDGRVVFRLPLLFDIHPQEDEGENMWYAGFRGGCVNASMFVNWHENLFIYYEDGEPADFSEMPEMLNEVMKPHIEGGRFETAPRGWIELAVDADDDDDVKTPDPGDDVDPDDWRLKPMLRHHWTYLHHIPGGFLRIDWLLLMAKDEVGEAPLPELVGLLDKEIRAARFPKPETVN